MPGQKSLFDMDNNNSSDADDVSLTTNEVVDRKSCQREIFAEFLGTMILVLIGDGVVCQTVLSQSLEKKNASTSQNSADMTAFAGDWTTISMGFGIALMVGLYVSAGVSGGHLNPAVTLAMCRHNRLSWKKAPYYVAAQFGGAFVGAMLVFFVYYSGLAELNDWSQGTAGIFATYPKRHEGVGAGFLDELLGTALLLLGIFAITDKFNNQAEDGMKPVVIGMLLTGIALSFGYNTGFALNPARDFAPRMFTAMAGWGGRVFVYGNGYFWIPVIAPLFGALLGSECYVYLIARHHPVEYIGSSELIKDQF